MQTQNGKPLFLLLPLLPPGCNSIERAMFQGGEAYFAAADHLSALAALHAALAESASSCTEVPFLMRARGLHRTLAEDLYSIERDAEEKLERERTAPKRIPGGGPGSGPGSGPGGGSGGGPGSDPDGGPGGGPGSPGGGDQPPTDKSKKFKNSDPIHARVFGVLADAAPGDTSTVSFGSAPAAAAAAAAAAGRAAVTAAASAGGAAAAAAGKAAAATAAAAGAAGVARITVELASPPMALVDGLLREGEAKLLIAARDRLMAEWDGPPHWCFPAPEMVTEMAAELRRRGAPEAETVTTADLLELYDTEGAGDMQYCLTAAASAVLGRYIPFSSSVRVSPGADPTVDALSRRIEAVTGLNESHGQYFSITTYAEREGYSHHVDCEGNDRAATLLMYLTDVPDGAGGHTVFPGLSVSVQPKKGRGLVWRNLSPSGKCNMETEHLAEPIADHAAGQKVILQRWYHSHRTALMNLPKLPMAMVGANPRSPQVVCADVSKCRWYNVHWSS